MPKYKGFHEDFTRDDEVGRSSERTFGLTVGGILALVGGARVLFFALTATNVVLAGRGRSTDLARPGGPGEPCAA